MNLQQWKSAFEILVWLALATFFLECACLVDKVSPLVIEELTDLHRVTLTIGGAAGELEKSSREWRQASQQSEEISAQTTATLKNLSDATARMNTAAASLNALIQHTDDSLNVVLLPQLSSTIGGNNDRLAKLTADTDATVLTMGATGQQAAAAMAEATKTLAQAGKVLGDPAIPAIMAKTQATAQNVADTTAHLDAASADIQKKVHQMTAPASFAKRVGETVLTIGAPIVQIFK